MWFISLAGVVRLQRFREAGGSHHYGDGQIMTEVI